jgi:CRISPR/Cas system-associated exonuclease Cas4 (RecB family)
MRVVLSSSAAVRLDAARGFLGGHLPGSEVVIVGASRGAADDLARDVARRTGATFGLARFSLTEIAARAAAARLAGARRVPGSSAGAEAMAARAVFDAIAADELAYFAPVAALPGFPKALARTVHELRLAGVSATRLSPDLAVLLSRVEAQLAQGGVDDRAALFRLAAEACRAGQVRWATLPLVLLDVPIDSLAEQEFTGALAGASPDVLATVPDDDRRALEALTSMGAIVTEAADDAESQSDLASLRRYVFRSNPPPARERAGDVRLFSAPGEGREAVEIVRRIFDEAARGVRFDEIAILLRAPRQYLGLLEHACARGDVPVYFDRGTRRPDPAGRAFLALLACGVEGLSAKRFDEYLSLGQVPAIGGAASGTGAPAAASRGTSASAVLADSAAAALLGIEPQNVDEPEQPDQLAIASDGAAIDSDEEAIVAGTLRSPWKWEELIVESAVVGGRTREDGGARWRRRLDGLANDYRIRIAELRTEEPESARIARFERDLANLAHLRRFALPIIDTLAEWPDQATWGDWLERFAALAGRTLRRPQRVLQVLADLRPMAAVGPVSLEEARDVLHDRLVTLDWEPPARRYGRVFVGTPHQARGRTFRVVFVPGLAERIVPQRPREDPLLLDEQRRAIDQALVDQEQRGSAERLLLKIAIGAASERVYLSYPRLDVAETRARVPSFYALDVMRAITGRVPDHRVLAAEAAAEGGASLAWPAPQDPNRAIDDLEHDLAVLEPLLQVREPAAVRGRAHYMLGLNDALRRSVISRWARGRAAWSTSDGLIRVSPSTEAALRAQRLRERPYSLSALQRFATCPYQFLLATIYRLEPWDEPEPLVRMDPLTRGSLFHKVQTDFYRAMASRDALPVTRANLVDAVATLDRALDAAAATYEEELAPAIDRVWRDEIDELRRDLTIWVQKLADDDSWRPAYFEYSFGLHDVADAGRDPRSLPDPILVDGKYVLRGSVDLIEQHAQFDVLRVTDHKTGKNRATADLVVGGGTMLQGVLYSVAVEQALGKRVMKGRYYYATTAGGFADKEIEINDYTRSQGLQVLAIVDRAIETGFLAAAPAERACGWCDFRPVCGPREDERTRRKTRDKLADLEALRGLR